MEKTKTFKKVLMILTMLMLLTIICPLKVNASDEAAFNGYQINPDRFSKTGHISKQVKAMYEFTGVIVGAIQIVGTIVSAGALIIIGIRYVVGSADEKAEYKERMIPFVLGAVLLFSASNVVKVLYTMFSHLE